MFVGAHSKIHYFAWGLEGECGLEFHYFQITYSGSNTYRYPVHLCTESPLLAMRFYTFALRINFFILS